MPIKGQEHRYESFVGFISGKLTVLEQTESTAKGRRQWVCMCECGNTTIVESASLKNKRTKSCGCIVKSKNGWGRTRFHNIYKKMMQRCNDKKDIGFKYYGLKGIAVDDPWHDFEKFKENMIDEYEKHCKTFGEKNTTLDRIDSTKNYSFENCKWSTYKEQENNRTNNRFVTVGDFTGTVSETARHFNINPSTASIRLYRGWSIEKTFTTPVKKSLHS